MPLTLAQALATIPALKTARVVAGEQNLDQPILWTHIIDHPDILPWVQEGHLLLTTAFALMLNPESQTDLIPHLSEKKLAGMMVNVGRYMGEIPAAMVAAAHKAGFPLIALPWEINFADVTHSIHERIIHEQYALSEHVFRIHEVLTHIVVEGCGLDELAAQLANLLNRSVTIEDSSFTLLAYKSIEPVDQVRQRSILDGRTPQEVIAFHTRQGLWERLRQERRPQKVDPAPDLGLTLERVVAPIIVGPHLLGYIWVIATDHPLTELDFLAIERGASLAALILSREQAVYEAEQRVKNSWLDNLLDQRSSQSGDGWPEMLRKLGLAAGYQVLVVECLARQPQIVQSRIITDCTQAAGLDPMIVERAGRLVVILAGRPGLDAHHIAAQIREAGAASHCPFAIGISRSVTGTARFRPAYEEALDALRVGQAVAPDGGAWSAERLGYLMDLLDRPSEHEAVNAYRSLVAVLASYDEKHDAQLLRTLDVYIHQLADIQKAAAALFIHRNTLYQRLDRIAALCQVDLNDFVVILNLYLALQVWKLENSLPQG